MTEEELLQAIRFHFSTSSVRLVDNESDGRTVKALVVTYGDRVAWRQWRPEDLGNARAFGDFIHGIRQTMGRNVDRLPSDIDPGESLKRAEEGYI